MQDAGLGVKNPVISWGGSPRTLASEGCQERREMAVKERRGPGRVRTSWTEGPGTRGMQNATYI